MVHAVLQSSRVSLVHCENEQTARKKQHSAFSKPSATLMECSILVKDCDWLAESAIAIRLIKWNHGTPVQVLMKQPSKSWRKKSQERSQEAYCLSRNGKWVASASRVQDGVTQDAEVWPRSARLRCPSTWSAAECSIIGKEREVIITSDLKWLQKRLCTVKVLNDPRTRAYSPIRLGFTRRSELLLKIYSTSLYLVLLDL